MVNSAAQSLDHPAPVLLVEDNADAREVLAEMLELSGYRVVTAGHGGEALAWLQRASERPCLIVCDYHMPVMDGLTFRHRQVADRTLADIPLVLYSGAYDIRRLAAGLNLPHVFEKPLDPEKILALVREHC